LPAFQIHEVLFYAAREVIRNAALYGRGDDASRLLRLRISAVWQAPASDSAPGSLEISIKDDGAGLNIQKQSGAGHGLALHSTMMAVVGGMLTIESVSGQYTRVLLALPGG
jgi:nitrogen-specific signal transduction histidine kinase